MSILSVPCPRNCHCHTTGGRCGIVACCDKAGARWPGYEPVPERDHLTDDELLKLRNGEVSEEEKRIMNHHWTSCHDCMVRMAKIP